MRLPGSHSSTRSIMRIGNRCGRCASTWWMSISAIAPPFASDVLLERPHAFHELREMPDDGRVASPGFVVVGRVHPRVGAWLADRARNHRGNRHRHVIADRQVSDYPRGAADGAVRADIGAAGDGRAARHGGMRADPAVVADLDLVVELDAVADR